MRCCLASHVSFWFKVGSFGAAFVGALLYASFVAAVAVIPIRSDTARFFRLERPKAPSNCVQCVRSSQLGPNTFGYVVAAALRGRYVEHRDGNAGEGLPVASAHSCIAPLVDPCAPARCYRNNAPRLVALRGDVHRGGGGAGDFRFANELWSIHPPETVIGSNRGPRVSEYQPVTRAPMICRARRKRTPAPLSDYAVLLQLDSYCSSSTTCVRSGPLPIVVRIMQS